MSKIKKKQTKIKSFTLSCKMNKGKESVLFDMYDIYKKEYKAHVKTQWSLFLHNKVLPYGLSHGQQMVQFSHLGSTKDIETKLNSAYLQSCLAQSCATLNNHLANIKNIFESLISKTEFFHEKGSIKKTNNIQKLNHIKKHKSINKIEENKDKHKNSLINKQLNQDFIHQLRTINLNHVWLMKNINNKHSNFYYYPNKIIVDDFGNEVVSHLTERKLISCKAFDMANYLFKYIVAKKIKFPNLNKPRFLLDSRLYTLEKSKKNKLGNGLEVHPSFDYWLHISTLTTRERISIPLKSNPYFEKHLKKNNSNNINNDINNINLLPKGLQKEVSLKISDEQKNNELNNITKINQTSNTTKEKIKKEHLFGLECLGKSIELNFKTFDYAKTIHKHNSLCGKKLNKNIKINNKLTNNNNSTINTNNKIKHKLTTTVNKFAKVKRQISVVFNIKNEIDNNINKESKTKKVKGKTIAFDLGLSCFLATSDGEMLGTYWLNKLKAYDKHIQSVLRGRQQAVMRYQNRLKNRHEHIQKMNIKKKLITINATNINTNIINNNVNPSNNNNTTNNFKVKNQIKNNQHLKNIKINSRRLVELTNRVRGFLETETNRILKQYFSNEHLNKKNIKNNFNNINNNNYIETVVVENLKFSHPDLSKRLNRIIKNFGFKLFHDKLEELSKGGNQDINQSKPFNIVKLNPAYSSQECSHCGYVDEKNRSSQKVFKCLCCGHTGNADVQSARVLLKRFESWASQPKTKTLAGNKNKVNMINNKINYQTLNKGKILEGLKEVFVQQMPTLASSGIVSKRKFKVVWEKNRYFSTWVLNTAFAQAPMAEPLTAN